MDEPNDAHDDEEATLEAVRRSHGTCGCHICRAWVMTYVDHPMTYVDHRTSRAPVAMLNFPMRPRE